jgi:hypothetical protein
MSRKKKYSSKSDSAPQPVPVKKAFFTESFFIKVIILIQLFLLTAEFTPELSTNGDDATYFIISKALAHGQGYHDISLSDNRLQVSYPVLYPALLTFTSLISENPLLPKLMMGLLSILAMLTLYLVIRRYCPRFALPLFILMAASNSYANFSTVLMSDMPYLLATLAALYLLEKSKEKKTMVFIVCAIVAAVLPVHVRTVGISFCAAWALENILEKRYRQAIIFIAVLVTTLLVMRFAFHLSTAYSGVLFQKDVYNPEQGALNVSGIISRIITNFKLYSLRFFPNILTGIENGNSLPWQLFGAVVSFITFIGLGYGFFQKSRILSIYVIFYLGILLAWPEKWTSSRFLLPVLPFLYYYLLSGSCILYGIVESRFRRTKIKRPFAINDTSANRILLWSCLLLISFVNITERFRAREEPDRSPDWDNYYSCADWVRNNTPSNAVIVSRKPELFYLRSERKGFLYPLSHDVKKVIDGIKKGGATYVVLDNFRWSGTSARYLFPAISSHPELFKVVYSLHNPETYVLRFFPK